MEIRPNIKAVLPRRMRPRPVDHRGFPVPWFVTERDKLGNWDFRIIDPHRQVEALQQKRCWICGERLGAYKAFAVGPMCGINRTSGEPPQHLECAEFAVRVCPFMLSPLAKRSDRNMVVKGRPADGGLCRNPGVTLVWSTKSFKIMNTGRSLLFRMGEPIQVTFWREGRAATREEILESVNGGIHHLKDAAEADGPEAMLALGQMTGTFMKLLPAAA